MPVNNGLGLSLFEPMPVNDPRLSTEWYCDTSEDGDVEDRAVDGRFVQAVIKAVSRLSDIFFE